MGAQATHVYAHSEQICPSFKAKAWSQVWLVMSEPPVRFLAAGWMWPCSRWRGPTTCAAEEWCGFHRVGGEDWLRAHRRLSLGAVLFGDLLAICSSAQSACTKERIICIDDGGSPCGLWCRPFVKETSVWSGGEERRRV